MADRKVSITISAEDKFSDTFKKYKQGLGETSDANAKVEKQVGKTTTAWGGLQKAIGGAVAAYGVGQTIQTIARLTAEGNAAKLAAGQFDALAGGAETADALIAQLRETTKGSVSDFDLMLGSNQLMTMGLADTNDEVNQLIEMALALRKPTQSAGDAIDDFAKLLANQSVMRLDNFGISSGRVRDRIKELQDEVEGLNREDAFKMAVLEIGAESMERFGDASGIVDSSLLRLQTRFKNARSEVAQFTATGVEAGAQLIEMGILVADFKIGQIQDSRQQQTALANAASENAEWYVGQFMAELGNSANYDTSVYKRAMEQALLDPTRAFSDILFQEFGINTRTADPAMYDEIIQAMEYAQDLQLATNRAIEQEAAARQEALDVAQSYDRVMIQSGQNQVAFNERNALSQRSSLFNMQQITAQQSELNQQLKAEEERRLHLVDVGNRQFEFAQRQALELRQQQMQANRDANNARNLSASALAGATGATIGQYFDPAQVSAMQSFADDAQRALEAAEELGLGDDEIAGFRVAADETRKIADQAQRAADEFERASLSDIFGQTSGGRQQEIADRIISAMQDAEMDPEAIAAFQSQAALQTGRETETSQAFEQIVTDVLAGLPLEQQLLAMQNIDNSLNQMALAGQNTSNLDENALLALAGFVNGSIMAPSPQAAPLDPAMLDRGIAGDINARMTPGSDGEDGESPLQQTQTQLEEINAVVEEMVPPDFSPAAWGLDLSSATIDDITGKLEDIDGRIYQAEVKIKVTQDGSSPMGAQITGSIRGSSNDISTPGGYGH